MEIQERRSKWAGKTQHLETDLWLFIRLGRKDTVDGVGKTGEEGGRVVDIKRFVTRESVKTKIDRQTDRQGDRNTWSETKTETGAETD